ncbi:hypothetical protein GCM10023224_40730 [Streptomonospora halophila]|uniref:Uncharacterized protein n=1 Tax=Streptomonospora halophila TaxID=427369 RepID=A0ABP9GS32_9ACTN
MRQSVFQHIEAAETQLEKLYTFREEIHPAVQPSEHADLTYKIAMIHVSLANGIRGGCGCG